MFFRDLLVMTLVIGSLAPRENVSLRALSLQCYCFHSQLSRTGIFFLKCYGKALRWEIGGTDSSEYQSLLPLTHDLHAGNVPERFRVEPAHVNIAEL